MKKSYKFLVSLSLLGLVGLAGCGKKESGSGDEGEKTVIRVGTWEGGDPYKIQQAIAAEYMKDNPDVEIKVESVPDQYATKILTQIAGGQAPDIYQIGDGDVSMFQSKGALVDLTDFMTTGENQLNLDDFYGNVLDIGKIDDKYYTMPKDFTTYNVFYNKKMFDEAGIEYPTDDWTWEEFREIAIKLTKKDGEEFVHWGANLMEPSIRPNLPLIYGYGGNVISDDGQTVEGIMNSDETKEAIRFYNQMKNIDKVAPTSVQSEAFSGADLFLSGKAAMNVMGIWPLQKYIDAELDFGVVKSPKGPEGQYNSIAYAGYGIYSKSKNQEEAWKYLKYLSTKGQEKLAEHALSAYIPVSESSGQTSDVHKKVFIDAIDDIKMFPERLNFNFGKTAGEAMTSGVFAEIASETDGKFDTDTALDTAAKEGQKLMDQAMAEDKE